MKRSRKLSFMESAEEVLPIVKDVQMDIQLAETLRLHGHTLRPIKFDLHVNSRCPCLANHVLPAS